MAFTWGGRIPPAPVRLKQKKFKAVEVGRGSAWGDKSVPSTAPVNAQVWEDAAQRREAPQRMAGEDPLLEEAFEYLSNQSQRDIDIAEENRINRTDAGAAEDAAIQDATEYMRIHNYNKGLAKGVQIPNKFQDDEEGLIVRRMKNNSPAPIVRRNRDTDIERRIHTEDVVNPISGVTQVVPVINPETGKALLTDFGDGSTGKIDGINISSDVKDVGDRASEYLAQRVLWLQGDKEARFANKNNPYQADFRDKDGLGVDAHSLRTGVHDGKVELQGFTELYGDNIQRDIKNEMAKGNNLFQAVENLKLTGAIKGGYYGGEGKLYKDGYDRLISPVFDRDEALLNIYDSLGPGNKRLQANMQDKSVLMPQKIYDIDLHKARDAVHNMSASQQQRILRVLANNGNNGLGRERARVNQVPSNKIDGVRDISNDGLVAQLLKEIPYA